ncbi:hypothetical protein DFH11DRAFT_1633133 [Phellopilus nigrolimitatus]|nr:hypothetical protein DFH11DRAFT_1633133 [Phellopilus nigrolimitatus]
MSYHREWDQGKDWEGGDYRGYTRGREDGEYYGEGKRRKYNNGGFEESQWSSHDDSRNYGQYGYDTSYDNNYNYPGNYNNFRDQSLDNRDDRSNRDRGGFQNRKKHVASEPSPHVIFLGLDPDFTEADLATFLKGCGCIVETVTVIRDRNTGQSKGFGFAQFRSTEEARSFVDPNFPFVSLPPPASYGASAAATFRRAEETGAQHDGKRVKIDYSQSANASGQGRRGPQFANDGTRDIGNTQSAVLLFRGLDPLSGPAAIAQAMKTSAGVSKEGARGMRRVLLIKDKATMASWGFAFVEFVDVQAASVVLAATMSPQLHPNGFRISDRPVAASFAHPYSFQPLADNVYQDDSCAPSSLNLGGMEGTWVKYWDEGSSLAVMDFRVEESGYERQATTVKEKKDKDKKKAKSPAVLAEASVLPVSDKPVTLNFNKIGSSAKATPGSTASIPSQAAFLFSANDDNDMKDDVSGDNNGGEMEDVKAKQAQRVPPMIASKKVVNNISKWNQVQEELSGHMSQPIPAASVAKDRTVTPDVEVEQEFSDTKAMTCLLCSRQFKSMDQLKRHNKESDLHKKNYKDANLRDVAREKARAANGGDQSPPNQSNQNALKVQYRDRASERRTLFNQPDMPLQELSQSKAPSKRSAEGPPPPPSPPLPPVAPGRDERNIGNKLLKMMGWTEGTGLGTEGEGRVDPIQTAIYASGAGLGASKGREVGKYEEGYSGYVRMAKDVARERYEN